MRRLLRISIIRAYGLTAMLALLAACQAELGDMDRARVNVADCLALRPNFSIAHYMRKEPFQIKADAERVEASLRRAGLPE